MSKRIVYEATCDSCGEDTSSEIEGDVDEFLRQHEDEENHDFEGEDA